MPDLLQKALVKFMENYGCNACTNVDRTTAPMEDCGCGFLQDLEAIIALTLKEIPNE